MPRTFAGTVVAGLVAAGLTLVCARRTGPLPPLGPLLDPVSGAAAAVRTVALPDMSDAVEGMGASVGIRYDDRGVPHIYAASREDAWRALGYVVARDRWFQMELTYRAAAGRLTELVGARALSLDQDARRLGLNWAAERKWAALPADDIGRRAMVAFAEGANAWRAHMTPATTPVEYKLLGVDPMARWEPQYAAYLLMRMALTLAHDPEELERTRVAALVGRAAADALLPRDMPIQEPIQPVPGRTAPREALGPLPPPGPPDTTLRPALSAPRALERVTRARSPRLEGGDALGSNNWAVAPARSANGTALLAGDPHLDLTLPSIWYEAHLVVKDSMHVYGVTFPGAPSIIIGFTRDLAWTPTNTGGDVGDWYVEELDAAGARYRVDGAWRPLERRIERYTAPDATVLAVDTILHTHRGPVVVEDGRPMSYRWTAHDPSRDVNGFIGAATARSVEEFRQAMLGYAVPTQNMLVADRHGTIAFRSHGAYPVRPAGATGAYVQDGRTSAADWTGWLPVERYPQAVNPAQGYLASANQQPLDPVAAPQVIGSHWAEPWRALRINELLRGDARVTPDAMRRFQTDPLSTRARTFVPLILAAVGDDPSLAAGTALLRTWDYRYTLDARAPVLFQALMRAIARRTWDELVPPGAERPVAMPSELALLQLFRDSASTWWDDRRTTAEREDRRRIVRAALRSVFDSLETALGPVGPAWAWERRGGIHVNHLLRLPGFSRRGLAVTSGVGTLAPAAGMGGSHGASWRMVVELGQDRRTAWAIYPGGQSGNPASPHYADRLEAWRTGRLDSLLVPPSIDSFPPARLAGRLVLHPRPVR